MYFFCVFILFSLVFYPFLSSANEFLLRFHLCSVLLSLLAFAKLYFFSVFILFQFLLSLFVFAKCISFAFSFYSVLYSIPSCVRQMYFFCVFILSSLVIPSCVRKIVFLLRLKNDPSKRAAAIY